MSLLCDELVEHLHAVGPARDHVVRLLSVEEVERQRLPFVEDLRAELCHELLADVAHQVRLAGLRERPTKMRPSADRVARIARNAIVGTLPRRTCAKPDGVTALRLGQERPTPATRDRG